ncbi:MAG TPA: nuclear transport factor 2 family protein [Sphingomicrobium sp.]|nr:nuclear transport factor 2 family protein [Sphingomicrobium sp.]
MSLENVELVRSGFAAFQRGDLSQMLDLLADDLVTYRADPDGATYAGKEGFLEATADWTEGFSDWSAIPEEFIDAGDWVLTRVRQVARGEGSGISVEGEFWFAFEVRGTRISKLSFYSRQAEALEAVGLPE